MEKCKLSEYEIEKIVESAHGPVGFQFESVRHALRGALRLQRERIMAWLTSTICDPGNCLCEGCLETARHVEFLKGNS